MRRPAGRSPRGPEDGPQRPDLTPMVDLVFNLIVFFLVVSELSNLQLETLQLARADQARPPEGRPPGLAINVRASGEVRARGATWQVGARRPAEEAAPLRELLALEAAGHPREAALPGSVGQAPSTLRLDLRVDREARFGRVQEVLDPCQAEGLYRLSFAADPEAPVGPGR